MPTTAMAVRLSPSAPLLRDEGLADMVGSRESPVISKFVNLLEHGMSE